MDQLLEKAKIDLRGLRREIEKLAAHEVTNLSEPCYYPKTKKFYFILLNSLKLKDKDVKDFVKRTYKGTKASSWMLYQDPATNLLLVIMRLFLQNGWTKAYLSTLIYHLVVQYSRIMHGTLPYCNPDIFRSTIETLTKTHLFVRERSVGNALLYLANEISRQKKMTENLLGWTLDGIINFQVTTRHRVAQSAHSFITNYHKVRDEGGAIKAQPEPEADEEHGKYQYTVLERGKKAIDDVVKKFVVYKTIDRKALEDAKKFSKVKTSFAVVISNALRDKKYADDIRMILKLYIKGIDNTNLLCGKGYEAYVKRLMAVKRTRSQIYFKQQINILLEKVLKDTKNKKIYDSYTSQTQFIINSFLAYYITSTFKNSVC
jgi:hypothetical protein